MPNPARHAIDSAHAPADPYNASDVNQFLGTPASALLYQGKIGATGPAAVTTYDGNYNVAPQFLDQPFVTAAGQTSITRVELMPFLNNAGTDTLIGIYADAAGVPTGAALGTCELPLDFVPAGGSVYLSLPFNITGLIAATKYHIVIAGSPSNVNWIDFRAGVTTGNAATANGVGVGGAWVSVGNTLMFNVFYGVNGALRHIIEDAGAAWHGLDYATAAGTSGPPSIVKDYTTGNASSPVPKALRSMRTATYTNGILTSVA